MKERNIEWAEEYLNQSTEAKISEKEAFVSRYQKMKMVNQLTRMSATNVQWPSTSSLDTTTQSLSGVLYAADSLEMVEKI